MKYGEILYEAMQLPVKQQHSLVWALSKGFPYEKRKRVRMEECKRLLWRYAGLMGEAMNVQPEAIVSRSRVRAHVYGRWVIWHKLYKDGFSQSLIAKVTGFHHSVANIGIKRVEEVSDFPYYDPELTEVYEKFYNALNHENDSNNTADNGR